MSTKTVNANKAKEWLNTMKSNSSYLEYIQKSINNTSVINGKLISKEDLAYIKKKIKEANEDSYLPQICISGNTTYDEIKDAYYESDRQIAVLNFASYYNPGGGFLKGSIAQEESLCHVSGLYNILSSLPVYERRAQTETTLPEYFDSVIYSPAVPFTITEESVSQPYLVDVISVSAPNCNRTPIARYEEYVKALKRRIEAIFVLPYIHGCTKIILGAWGCGVFKNDPKLIAQYFLEYQQKYGQLYDEIVYAVPGDTQRNIFNKIIMGE